MNKLAGVIDKMKNFGRNLSGKNMRDAQEAADAHVRSGKGVKTYAAGTPADNIQRARAAETLDHKRNSRGKVPGGTLADKNQTRHEGGKAVDEQLAKAKASTRNTRAATGGALAATGAAAYLVTSGKKKEKKGMPKTAAERLRSKLAYSDDTSTAMKYVSEGLAHVPAEALTTTMGIPIHAAALPVAGLAALLTKTKTPEELATMDRGASHVGNALVPGLGAYRFFKRLGSHLEHGIQRPDRGNHNEHSARRQKEKEAGDTAPMLYSGLADERQTATPDQKLMRAAQWLAYKTPADKAMRSYVVNETPSIRSLAQANVISSDGRMAMTPTEKEVAYALAMLNNPTGGVFRGTLRSDADPVRVSHKLRQIGDQMYDQDLARLHNSAARAKRAEEKSAAQRLLSKRSGTQLDDELKQAKPAQTVKTDTPTNKMRAPKGVSDPKCAAYKQALSGPGAVYHRLMGNVQPLKQHAVDTAAARLQKVQGRAAATHAAKTNIDVDKPLASFDRLERSDARYQRFNQRAHDLVQDAGSNNQIAQDIRKTRRAAGALVLGTAGAGTAYAAGSASKEGACGKPKSKRTFKPVKKAGIAGKFLGQNLTKMPGAYSQKGQGTARAYVAKNTPAPVQPASTATPAPASPMQQKAGATAGELGLDGPKDNVVIGNPGRKTNARAKMMQAAAEFNKGQGTHRPAKEAFTLAEMLGVTAATGAAAYGINKLIGGPRGKFEQVPGSVRQNWVPNQPAQTTEPVKTASQRLLEKQAAPIGKMIGGAWNATKKFAPKAWDATKELVGNVNRGVATSQIGRGMRGAGVSMQQAGRAQGGFMGGVKNMAGKATSFMAKNPAMAFGVPGLAYMALGGGQEDDGSVNMSYRGGRRVY